MNDEKVLHVDHNERADLLHTDTIAAGADTAVDPGGYEQSLNPTGEVPVAGEGVGSPSDDSGVAARVGQDPANLGNDIPDAGDIVHPGPVNAPIGRTPGM
jgi:hypothetical protein